MRNYRRKLILWVIKTSCVCVMSNDRSNAIKALVRLSSFYALFTLSVIVYFSIYQSVLSFSDLLYFVDVSF